MISSGKWLTWICLFISPVVFSQENNTIFQVEIPDSDTRNTDSFSRFLKNNCKNEEEILRTLFVWEANNIAYDDANQLNPRGELKTAEIIHNTLQKRKAVCQGYCETFHEICQKAGLTTYVVVGYTRQNGKIDPLSHSWIVARLGKNWFSYDPTWAAGFLKDGRFKPLYNDKWYKVDPGVFIESHMPFDPVWQLLANPTTKESWENNRFAPLLPGPYDFNDTIDNISNDQSIVKFRAEIQRIESDKVTNSLTSDRLKYLKRQLAIWQENEKITMENRMVDHFNQSVTHYNKASSFYNQFVRMHAKKTGSMKTEMENLLNQARAELTESQDLINQVKTSDISRKKDVISIKNSIKELNSHLEKELKSLRSGPFQKKK